MNVVTGIACSACGAARPEQPGPCANCGDTRRTFAAEMNVTITPVATCDVAVKRGPESWGYIRYMASLVVTIAIAIIASLNIPAWAKIIYSVAVVAALLISFAHDGKVHNWLLALRRSYEDRWR